MIRRPMLTLAIALLLAAGAIGLCAARLRIDTSLASLFNQNDPSVSVLLGNGNGTFQLIKSYFTGTGSNPTISRPSCNPCPFSSITAARPW